MINHYYVKDDMVMASSPAPILEHIEQDFQTRFSRDFFGLPKAEKEAFNVFIEVVQGVGLEVDDDFSIATDTGPIWNGTTVTRTVCAQSRSLSEVKTRLKERLKSRFTQHRDRGVSVTLGQSTVFIDTSMDAQQDIAALVRRLEHVGGSQTIRTRSGTVLTADLSIAQAIFNAVENHIAAVWSNDAALGSAIDTAINVTQLKAVDFDSGWPGQK